MANTIIMYISVCKMYSYIIQADRGEGQCYTVTEQLGVGVGVVVSFTNKNCNSWEETQSYTPTHNYGLHKGLLSVVLSPAFLSYSLPKNMRYVSRQL